MSRTSLLRSLALLGSAGLACAHPGGSAKTGDGAGGAGPVELKFAWPDGFQSHVLIAHEARRSGAEPTGLIARQRMVAEKQGSEVRVSTRDVAARGNEPDLESIVKINEALVQVVAPDGRFRRAEGLDQALAAIKTATPEEREKARQALIRSTAFDWELMVGAWAGEQLAPDQPKRKQLQGYVPHIVAVEALLEVEYGLEGRVPCTEQETERRCVQLSYRASLAPGDRPATLDRLRRITTSEAAKATPEDVHADIELLLVTEPETLIPHRMTQRERLRLRLRLAEGRVVETEDRSEDTYLFSDRELSAPEPERKPESKPEGRSGDL
ncbi:hypothetical protein [Anaeromyxobacter diazotrophicus]|uniref:hypothetical protein n=1 Tax=Anaeromyxobacter diazotrophicus TaxID=2590199 RepID=UPI0015914C6F|nr:hypothetical protein [Anaeromyxobacter diazotrophicus]